MVPDYRLDTTLVKKIIHAFRPAVAFDYLERHITVYLYSKNINLDWVLISYSTLEPSSRIGIRRVPTTVDQGGGRSWARNGVVRHFPLLAWAPIPVWQVLENYLVCCSRNNFSQILATLSLSFSARGNASERPRDCPQSRRASRTEPPSTLGHHQSARRPSRPSDPAGSPRLFADRNRSLDRFLTPHNHLLVPAFSNAAIGRFARQAGSWAQNVLAG